MVLCSSCERPGQSRHSALMLSSNIQAALSTHTTMAISRRRGGGRHHMSILYASVLGVVAARSEAIAAAFVQPRSVRQSRSSAPARAAASRGIASVIHRRTFARDLGQKAEVATVAGAMGATSSSSSASSSSATADGGAEQIVTVIGETETEETIKKSRFIGRCGPAATFEEGKALLGRVLQTHPKARHSCWAWRGLGDEHRFSDDGEPGGTAGQPILGGIESEGVSEVMVVVTRYSGGIKLGTGGLCRAYGGGSRLCLQAAERETRTPMLRLSVTAPVDSVGAVYHAVSDCQRLSEEFTVGGSIVLRVAVELGQVPEVRRRLQDATKGAAKIVEEESRPGD